MKLRYIYEFFTFVSVVLMQVLLFNHITLFGYATPILYIYFLIKLPLGRNLFFVIISAFLLGLCVDVFMNTPGMNAAATTLVACFRKPMLSAFSSREDYEDFIPGMYVSSGSFVRFCLFFVVLHLTILFFIESFTLFNLKQTLLRIVSSAALSLILIFAIDSLIFNTVKRE